MCLLHITYKYYKTRINTIRIYLKKFVFQMIIFKNNNHMRIFAQIFNYQRCFCL